MFLGKIKESDALLLTSKYEVFPIVICEVISRGNPSGSNGLFN